MKGIFDLFTNPSEAQRMGLLNFGAQMLASDGSKGVLGDLGTALPGAVSAYKKKNTSEAINNALVSGDQSALYTALAGSDDDVMQKLLLAKALKGPTYKTVGNTLGRFDEETGAFKPVYTDTSKQWETVNDPMFGRGQRNLGTGEFKPVKTDMQDPAKANQAKEEALNVTNRLLNNLSGVRANRGGISRMIPNVSDSAVNAEGDLDTLASLLTTENLGLLKGVLSDTDMRVLKDIGAGGLKGADQQVINNLYTLRTKLSGQLGRPLARSNPAQGRMPVTGGKLNLADPRVQEALDQGYSEAQILQYFNGR